MKGLGRVQRVALRLSAPLFAPLLDRIAGWRDPGPAALRARVDAAITAGIGYFERLDALTIAPLAFLTRLHREGLEPRLAFMATRVAAYRAQHVDPHLRLVDRDYVAAEATGDATYRHPIERLMIGCLEVDRRGNEAEMLAALAGIEDGGGYGTTHKMIGALFLREFGAQRTVEIDALAASGVPVLLRAQRRAYVDDLFAERIVALQAAAPGLPIDRRWIVRLLAAQRDDGGWAAGPSLGRSRSSQHTSCLALMALVRFRAAG